MAIKKQKRKFKMEMQSQVRRKIWTMVRITDYFIIKQNIGYILDKTIYCQVEVLPKL